MPAPRWPNRLPMATVGGKRRRAGSLPRGRRGALGPSAALRPHLPCAGGWRRGASLILVEQGAASCSDFSSSIFCFICCRHVVIRSAVKRLFPDAFSIGSIPKLAFPCEIRLLPFFLRSKWGLYFSFQAPKGGRSGSDGLSCRAW